jgi:AcrR family transcriptional regulator
MSPEKNDRRSLRTRATLFKALSDLMTERRYEDITVQDIIDRANVGRSTFYDHFVDKEALAEAMFVYHMDLLVEAMTPERFDAENFLPGPELFDHLRERSQMFKTMTSGRGMEFLMRKGQQYWSERMAERLQSMLPPGQTPKVPIPVLAHFISGVFVNMLKWWMDTKMAYSSEQMIETIKILVLPGVQAGLFGGR